MYSKISINAMQKIRKRYFFSSHLNKNVKILHFLNERRGIPFYDGRLKSRTHTKNKKMGFSRTIHCY